MFLREIMKNRDGMSDEEIESELSFCREVLSAGVMTPEDVCLYLGVEEEDYLGVVKNLISSGTKHCG